MNALSRTLIKELATKAGQEVRICGSIDVRRDHGKLVFLDIRDASGKVQAVALPNNKEAHAAVQPLRGEWIIEAIGMVNARPPKMVNATEPNGSVELELKQVNVLNAATTPPIDPTSDGRDIGEEARLTYRYIDLRRPRLQKNIRNRHKVQHYVRNRLTEQHFTEIETPLLSASTPEGSRDFLVPSRLERGAFYALPQSPQQYKQLLMSAGFERYFQFARCMRDEDTRGDRQPEFTQLDMEMAYVEPEDVMALNEALLIELVTKFYPHKKIQQVPFPRMTYAEAIKQYGSDKPDIRKDKSDPDLLAFLWVVDFPFFEKDEESGGWTFTHNPFSAPKQEHRDALMDTKAAEASPEHIGRILTTQYDITLNGYEIGGGSIRNHRPEALRRVFEIMGYTPERIETNFGHMLAALGSGTPPHGGIAWGCDRLMMLLENEQNMREVIACAKTGEGRDLMLHAPASVTEKQLQELGLIVQKKK